MGADQGKAMMPRARGRRRDGPRPRSSVDDARPLAAAAVEPIDDDRVDVGDRRRRHQPVVADHGAHVDPRGHARGRQPRRGWPTRATPRGGRHRLAAVEVEVVTDPLAVVGAPAITQLDPARRQGHPVRERRESVPPVSTTTRSVPSGRSSSPHRASTTTASSSTTGRARHLVLVEDRHVGAGRTSPPP